MQNIGAAILAGHHRRNYLNDPETKLVATRCAVCQKALKDSLSVNRSIGPDCWLNYFHEPEGLNAEARTEANAIIHFIAVQGKTDEALIACKRLEEIGFGQLAARIARRLVQIRIEHHDLTVSESGYWCEKHNDPGHFHVITPKSGVFIRMLKKGIPYHSDYGYYGKPEDATPPSQKMKFTNIPGNRTGWVIPAKYKPQIWAALQAAFLGFVGQSPEGKLFVIGGQEEAVKVATILPGMPGYVAPEQSESIEATP